jgi:RNA polymerase sigma factor (sigma-70 family)
MNHARWSAWRVASGQVKASIFAELMADNDPLAHKFAGDFIRATRCHTGFVVEDLLQAARIGLMVAIRRWKPDKGAFSTLAFQCARHEMQNVMRSGARPVSITRHAYLPKSKQDEAAAYYAQHGRDPEPEEIGVTRADVTLAQRANATYVPLTEADDVATSEGDFSPEDKIDRGRDARSLNTWLKRLSSKDRAAFWAGKRPDLEVAAKAYVAARRTVRVK